MPQKPGGFGLVGLGLQNSEICAVPGLVVLAVTTPCCVVQPAVFSGLLSWSRWAGSLHAFQEEVRCSAESADRHPLLEGKC